MIAVTRWITHAPPSPRPHWVAAPFPPVHLPTPLPLDAAFWMVQGNARTFWSGTRTLTFDSGAQLVIPTNVSYIAVQLKCQPVVVPPVLCICFTTNSVHNAPNQAAPALSVHLTADAPRCTWLPAGDHHVPDQQLVGVQVGGLHTEPAWQSASSLPHCDQAPAEPLAQQGATEVGQALRAGSEHTAEAELQVASYSHKEQALYPAPEEALMRHKPGGHQAIACRSARLQKGDSYATSNAPGSFCPAACHAPTQGPATFLFWQVLDLL